MSSIFVILWKKKKKNGELSENHLQINLKSIDTLKIALEIIKNLLKIR
jgi:hypothetical protein